jgi:NADPH:quinone reductase-like Zn-dependent oxidoreductase
LVRDSENQKNLLPLSMQAVRVHRFGGLEAITVEQIPRPVPQEGQVLIQVKAAGVGPWDALIRAGKSGLHQSLPLILGSDLAGIVAEVGPGVTAFQPGEEVFGVTGPLFTGAYAAYALADAAMIAPKPPRLCFVEAASVPVVASTAWQMVFDHAHVDATKRVLVQGAGGNVGAYAVQLLKWAGAEIIAAVVTQDVDYARSLGADQIIDVQTTRFEEQARDIDIVLDLVGGETLDRSFDVLKPGGVLVSVVDRPDQEKAEQRGVRAEFFYVDVTTEGLTRLTEIFQTGQLATQIGEVLPLAEARLAHEMLAGKPHKRGKIVLTLEP